MRTARSLALLFVAGLVVFGVATTARAGEQNYEQSLRVRIADPAGQVGIDQTEHGTFSILPAADGESAGVRVAAAGGAPTVLPIDPARTAEVLGVRQPGETWTEERSVALPGGGMVPVQVRGRVIGADAVGAGLLKVEVRMRADGDVRVRGNGTSWFRVGDRTFLGGVSRLDIRTADGTARVDALVRLQGGPELPGLELGRVRSEERASARTPRIPTGPATAFFFLFPLGMAACGRKRTALFLVMALVLVAPASVEVAMAGSGSLAAIGGSGLLAVAGIVGAILATTVAASLAGGAGSFVPAVLGVGVAVAFAFLAWKGIKRVISAYKDRQEKKAIEDAGHADPSNRVDGLKRLEKYGRSAEARKAATDRLADYSPHVRAAAWRTIGKIGDPKRLVDLREYAAAEKDPMVRPEADAAVKALHDSTVTKRTETKEEGGIAGALKKLLGRFGKQQPAATPTPVLTPVPTVAPVQHPAPVLTTTPLPTTSTPTPAPAPTTPGVVKKVTGR